MADAGSNIEAAWRDRGDCNAPSLGLRGGFNPEGSDRGCHGHVTAERAATHRYIAADLDSDKDGNTHSQP